MATPKANAGQVRVLSVVWFRVLPANYGGQKAVALFNKHLAELAPLVCLCSKNNEARFASYPVINTLPNSKASIGNPMAWLRMLRVVKQQQSTHLLLEFPYYGLAAVLCKRWLRCRLVVNTHNIEFLRFRELGTPGWRLLYWLERWTLRQADCVFFKTEQDLQTAKKEFVLPPTKLFVVPYGVEHKTNAQKAKAQEIVRRRHNVHANESLLLFAGTLDYAPNAEALLLLAEKLIPVLNNRGFNYRFLICGRSKPHEHAVLLAQKSERIVLVGETAEIETYFQAADVFVSTVVSGGGVQTKLLDALSHHLSVVCFASRSAGIYNAGEKLRAVPDGDWEAFAQAIEGAVRQRTDTPAAFFEAHDWSRIAADAHQKILAC